MTPASVSRKHPANMATGHTRPPTWLAVKAFQLPVLATGATLCLLVETGHLRKVGKALDLSLFSLGSSQGWLIGELSFLMFNPAVPLFLPLLILESTL